jgi:hypothetical protein
MEGSKSVLRVATLVLVESGFGLDVPDLALFVGKVLPSETDDFGKGGMVGLDLCGHVLILDEGRAEEDEGVGRSGDVVLWFLLPVALTLEESGKCVGKGIVQWRGEEGGLEEGSGGRGRIVESDGSHVWGEGDGLGGDGGGVEWRCPGELVAFVEI